MKRNTRQYFHLVGYVLGPGNLADLGDASAMSLRTILRRRPDSARYAVVRPVEADTQASAVYLVVDLYEVETYGGADMRVGKHTVHRTQEAAIALAQLLT